MGWGIKRGIKRGVGCKSAWVQEEPKALIITDIITDMVTDMVTEIYAPFRVAFRLAVAAHR